MSRCFPYPPPGYVTNGVPGEALIESIKLQNAKEKPMTERTKEKKREKKEKKKEKKRKVMEKSSKIEDAKIDKSKEDLYLVKVNGREDESEQLEKSGLTEEHEQPTSSQTLCYLSDSTQSSSKRKRDSSETSCSQIHGNVLRFRLPSLKIRESNESLSNEQLCSTSGRTAAAQPILPDQDQCLNNVKTVMDVKKVTPHSITCGHDKIPAVSGIKSHKDEKRLAELYSLIEDCVPLTLHYTEQDDDHWLFETKPREHGSKRCRSDNDSWLGASASLWPRAYHLPEAEMHALPYTVPF